jgi:hypothetical protein
MGNTPSLSQNPVFDPENKAVSGCWGRLSELLLDIAFATQCANRARTMPAPFCLLRESAGVRLLCPSGAGC